MQSSTKRDAVTAAVLFAALLVLAVLQYRWIGQVSEADRERLQQGLRGAVGRFSQDFNGELERLAEATVRGATPELWRGIAAYPQILKKVWAVDDVDLPAQFQRLTVQLAEGRGGRGGRPPILLTETVMAIAIPGSVVELDAAYVTETWIPELTAKHFGENYDVQVGPRVSQPPESEAAPLFTLRQGRGGGPPPFAGKQGKRGFDGPWMVVATYRQGTMSELVESLRLRNLAVSFGILLLMAASIAMLLRSTRRANALAQQQLEFVAGVTHELRTPLAVIQSASQNLADGIAAGEAQTKRYGGVIHDQSKRLGDMLEQVLRFAGLSSQHGELRRAPVDVAALVDEAAGEVAIEVRCDVAAGLPQIDGDHAALLHCLRNLLGNASKHAAGAPVTVAARAADDGVEITVEDGGAGLADDDLPHIFEPFYRGARAKSDQIQGSGLGLSLVKKIVEAHGGSVRATSVGGLSIRMQLPAVKG